MQQLSFILLGQLHHIENVSIVLNGKKTMFMPLSIISQLKTETFSIYLWETKTKAVYTLRTYAKI